ncbi:hypothetical protein [Aquibacillus rhizosphaerae]|uniref:Uncharacterized protein n=1 Tax=Aquibacillus rhizosphaerae TaxID=3051431 RepID=A0ABT7L6M7_9BACI|nr:hypothetical protein [Aquibacillus sp. LR5S19]MDL4840877.1 hypothetical protein [Aquibacillus sp. LR5S19]
MFLSNYINQLLQVENTWCSGERLYIDGQLQDENVGLGFSKVRLTGELKDGKQALDYIILEIMKRLSV